MRYRLFAGYGILLLALATFAAGRDHTAVFGPWVDVQMFVGPESARSTDTSRDMKIRPLYVDGSLEEFTTGQPHSLNDSQFVVRRAYRLSSRTVKNGQAQPFLWQRGGWVLVDRSRGRVSKLNLPDFDPFYSVASWSQDWVAYCGLSDDGTQVYGIIAKLDQRDPIVRKHLRASTGSAKPDGECQAPRWDQQPGHVTFLPIGGQETTVTIGAATTD
jgi:hypothetical protein